MTTKAVPASATKVQHGRKGSLLSSSQGFMKSGSVRLLVLSKGVGSNIPLNQAQSPDVFNFKETAWANR